MFYRLCIVILLSGLLMGFGSDGWSRMSSLELIDEISEPGQSLVIVDVREPELFEAGHIPGAINLPYPDAKQRALAELDADQIIVFVCHGGPMGDELAGILAGKGYRNVRNLAGGMRGWSGPLE